MTGTLQKIKNALTPGHHGTHGTHGTHGHHGTHGYTDANTTGTGLNGTSVATVAHFPEGVQTGYDGRVANTSEGPVQQVRIAIAPNCPAPAMPVAETRGEVCQAREFVEVEDRPIVKERIERVVEHVPVEKRFVVETRPVAETVLAERANIESLGVTEREIERTAGTTCPTSDPLSNIGGGSMMGGTGVMGGSNMVANECTTCGPAGGVGTGVGTGMGAVRREDAVEEMLDGREPLYNVPMKSH